MITVRPTAAGDLPGLCALFAARFGHRLTAEEWEWKYRQLPGTARSLVAVDGDGAVLAHAGALRLAARWQGGEGGIWQLADFAGRTGDGGLRPPLVATGRQLLADLPGPADAPWIFGFPNDRHFRLGQRVFGYRPLATLQQLAGPLPAARPPSDHGELWSGDRCDDGAEAAWERCAVLGVRRTAAFLNWRYWARPGRYYRCYRLRLDGAEGWAVFAFVGDDAWATELWLPPPAEWYAPMLAVAADLRAAGLRTWRFWPPPACGTAGLLQRLGVQASGEPRFVGCRGAGAAASRTGGAMGAHGAGAVDPIAAASGFYYAMGDHDLS